MAAAVNGEICWQHALHATQGKGVKSLDEFLADCEERGQEISPYISDELLMELCALMGTTKIEWCQNEDGSPGKTWSPLRARVKADAAEIARAKGYTSLVQIAEKMAGHVGPHCEYVSDGCKLCYSDTNNHRCLPANGTGLPFDRRSRDLVEPFIDEKILLEPLKWRKPQRIFVENQSDLFGEWVPDVQIDRVFAAMSLDYDMHWSEAEGNVRQSHHTWQVLTKRPERMLAYVNRIIEENKRCQEEWFDLPLVKQAVDISRRKGDLLPGNASILTVQWVADGMPGLWLGISCENRETVARINVLRKIQAAMHFLSIEPLLEDVGELDLSGIDWVIVGGESGPGARPMNIQWARDIVAQCKAAGVPCFVKQLGARPFLDRNDPEAPSVCIPPYEYFFKDRKGGDTLEWPSDLQVRQFPEAKGAA